LVRKLCDLLPVDNTDKPPIRRTPTHNKGTNAVKKILAALIIAAFATTTFAADSAMGSKPAKTKKMKKAKKTKHMKKMKKVDSTAK